MLRSATFRVIVGEGGAPSVRRQGARLPNARPDETPMWASSPVFRRLRRSSAVCTCTSVASRYISVTLPEYVRNALDRNPDQGGWRAALANRACFGEARPQLSVRIPVVVPRFRRNTVCRKGR